MCFDLYSQTTHTCHTCLSKHPELVKCFACLFLQDSILILKGKILLHSRESEEQNQLIRNDKQLILVQLRKLKAQKTKARAISKENLVKLTLESNATLKALRKSVDKVINGRGHSEQNKKNWASAYFKRFILSY